MPGFWCLTKHYGERMARILDMIWFFLVSSTSENGMIPALNLLGISRRVDSHLDDVHPRANAWIKIFDSVEGFHVILLIPRFVSMWGNVWRWGVQYVWVDRKDSPNDFPDKVYERFPCRNFWLDTACSDDHETVKQTDKETSKQASKRISLLFACMGDTWIHN